MKELLNKGKSLIFTAGFLSVIIISYFGIVHFKTKKISNGRNSITPKLLHQCAKIGSMLLYISIGLIFIQLSIYCFSKILIK
jgi:hypothetical protein